MSHKKAGAIVGILLILIALGIFVISKLEFVPKENKKKSQSSTTSITTTTEPVKITTSESTKVTSTREPESNSSSGLSLVEITAEDKLSYDSPEQSTTGVVSKKVCYLYGNQVVYAIELQATMGTESNTVEYFCTYSVYSQVEEGDMLNINYKQTTSNTYAVMSVKK